MHFMIQHALINEAIIHKLDIYATRKFQFISFYLSAALEIDHYVRFRSMPEARGHRVNYLLSNFCSFSKIGYFKRYMNISLIQRIFQI